MTSESARFCLWTLKNVNDVFYAPRPYSSWFLSAKTFLWESPVPCPEDGQPYQWNEEILNWIPIQ